MRMLVPVLFCVSIFAAGSGRTPPQVYVLEIDGTRHEIVGGRTYEIEVRGAKSTVRLTPRPYHEAETKWFSLRFPRGYEFEYDDGKDLGMEPAWTLDGEACFIKLTPTDQKSAKKAIESWAELMKLPDEKNERSTAKIRLDGRELEGLRLDDKFDPDLPFRTEIFAFRHAGRMWILHIHDAPELDGRMSKELRPLYEMFCKTFRLR